MCGRFALTLPPDALRQLFGFVEQPNLAPRFNIAPTQPIAIVRSVRGREDEGAVRHWSLVRWGLLPGFVKEPKGFPLLFNARAEGVEDKASFRNAVRRRRCLVPADGFYEWHRDGSGRSGKGQPYLCRRADDTTMGLAGLWETWIGPNGEEVDTACILTTAANAVSAAIHPRLPAIIEPADFAAWLDPDEHATADAIALLQPTRDDTLLFTPVSDRVNKVDNDGPDVQRPEMVGSVERPRDTPEQPSLF